MPSASIAASGHAIVELTAHKMAALARTAALGKLAPSSSALFVCDLQERFQPVIHNWNVVESTAGRLVRQLWGVMTMACHWNCVVTLMLSAQIAV